MDRGSLHERRVQSPVALRDLLSAELGWSSARIAAEEERFAAELEAFTLAGIRPGET